MQTDYTHMTVILDRSGSMEEIRDDIIGGFNGFLADQKALPGQATLTLIQFDGQEPYEVVHRFKTIERVPPLDHLTYVPRGTTPLLDAIGQAINDIEKAIKDLPTADRPAKVIVAIVTDGQENASVEFHRNDVVRMIKAKTNENAWEFVFLSADLAAIAEAGELGFGAMKRMMFGKSRKGTALAFRALSREAGSYRRGTEDSMAFSEDDRKRAMEPDEK